MSSSQILQEKAPLLVKHVGESTLTADLTKAPKAPSVKPAITKAKVLAVYAKLKSGDQIGDVGLAHELDLTPAQAKKLRAEFENAKAEINKGSE